MASNSRKRPGTGRLSVMSTKKTSSDRIRKSLRPKDTSAPKECEVVNIPYYTSEVDVNKIGPSIAVCTELLDQIGQEDMLCVIKKYGKSFIEANKYAHLPRKKRLKLEKEREKKWAQCPNHVELGPEGYKFGSYCPCGLDQFSKAPKASPEPGSIGVSRNHIAFHNNAPSNQVLPPTDPCVLKLGKTGDTQCITLQYEPEPIVRIPPPPIYERQVQVNEADLAPPPKPKTKKKKAKKRGKTGTRKRKGKSKARGKSKKGKKKPKK